MKVALMAEHDLHRFLNFADTLADAARAAILPYFRNAHSVEHKGGSRFDPVTEADRGAEKAMRALIEREFPEHGVIGEEFGTKPSKSGYSWALDPVDGTRAFIAGLPLWGVLIALAYEGKPIIGVMDQPYLDERYKGWGVGASLTTRGETRPLRTRSCEKLSDAILSTTDATLFHGAETHAFERVRAAARLTRYGYDCYAYAMVAMGGIDVVIESGLRAWDIQALIPIVEGAGGGVTSWDGGDAAHGGQVLACGDARVREEAMTLLKNAAA
ncbi:MAG TPA: histidinol-phosphatase [Caulobacterales bacterium]|nr:histidinol-phosphatase [Caulobacterales bacterium]